MRSLSKTPSPTQSPSYASYANDERWRIAAAYASTGTGGTASATLLERYVHHAAGQAGRGGGSYIDAVVLRDRDLDAEASSTTDGGTDPLEERTYILQNWRADVVATARRNGSVIEKMQYTAYGAAVTHLYHGTVRGDFNANGGVDGSDLETFELAWENSEPSTDVNFDGGIDSADWEAFLVIWATGELSTDIYESHAGACQTTAVRFGYAGYVRDGSVNGERVYTDAAAGLYHVRHRAYDPELGRWTRRDPIGYVDGTNLFAYCQGLIVIQRDPSGLKPPSCDQEREAMVDAENALLDKLLDPTYNPLEFPQYFSAVAILRLRLDTAKEVYRQCMQLSANPPPPGPSLMPEPSLPNVPCEWRKSVWPAIFPGFSYDDKDCGCRTQEIYNRKVCGRCNDGSPSDLDSCKDWVRQQFDHCKSWCDFEKWKKPEDGRPFRAPEQPPLKGPPIPARPGQTAPVTVPH